MTEEWTRLKRRSGGYGCSQGKQLTGAAPESLLENVGERGMVLPFSTQVESMFDDPESEGVICSVVSDSFGPHGL